MGTRIEAETPKRNRRQLSVYPYLRASRLRWRGIALGSTRQLVALMMTLVVSFTTSSLVYGQSYNGSLWWHYWGIGSDPSREVQPTNYSPIIYQVREIFSGSGTAWMKWEANWWGKQVGANSGGSFTASPDNNVVIDSRVRLGGSDWSCGNPNDIYISSIETGKRYVINIVDVGNALETACNDSMAAFAVNEINHTSALVTFTNTPATTNDGSGAFLTVYTTPEASGSCEELWIQWTTNNFATKNFIQVTSIGAVNVVKLIMTNQVLPASRLRWLVITSSASSTSTISGTTSGVLNFDAASINRTAVINSGVTPVTRYDEIVEQFIYDGGCDINAYLQGGRGWDSLSWSWWGGTVQTDDQSLSVPNNYPTAHGGKLRVDAAWESGGGVWRTFNTDLFFTTGRFYMGFTLRPDTGSGKYCGMDIKRVDGASDTTLAFVGVRGNSTQLGIEPKDGSPATNLNYTATSGDDHTMIIRYDFSTRELAAMGYYKTDTIPLTEPSTWAATTTLSSGFVTNIGRVAITCGSWGGAGVDPGNMYFDEIRFARTWKELLSQADATWDGMGANANWSTVDNWVGNVEPPTSSNVTFYDSIYSGTNINVDAAKTIAGIRFNDNADTALNITNNTLTIGAGGIGMVGGAGGAHVLATPIALSANQIWSNDSPVDLTVVGAVSGGYSITKGGAGRIVLGTNNTFSGSLSVDNGVVRVTHGNALGATSAGSTVASGAALELSGGITTAAEPLTLNGTGISSGGALRNISGNNTFAGAITLGSASRINSDSGTLTLSGGISGNYALTFGGSGNIVVNSVIGTGSGSVTKDGSGTLTLSGANTFSGGLTLSAGTLNINNATALGSGTFTISGVSTIDNTSGSDLTLTSNNPQNWNANFTFTGTRSLNMGTGNVVLGGNRTVTVSANTLTVGGAISGNYSLTKAGSGTLTLTGNNTYSGGTTHGAASPSRLNIGHNNALGSGTLTWSANNYLDVVGGARTIPNNVTLSASPTFLGSYDLTINGSFTLSGSATTRTLTVSASRLTIAGVLGGTQSLTKAGSGTLRLSGNNTISGGILLNAGTLEIGHANALGTGTFSINGGTFDNSSGSSLTVGNSVRVNANSTFAGSSPLTLSGGVTLTGSRQIDVTANTLTLSGNIGDDGSNYRLTKGGAGTLTLSGNNTFGGGVYLYRGRLNIGSATALGTGPLTNYYDYTVEIDNTSGGSLTINNALYIRGNYTFIGSAPLTIAGNGTVLADSTITVSDSQLTLAGNFGQDAAGRALTKAGSGVLVLSGANTYSGATTVNGGTLVHNGTNTSTAVTVASGAYLMGAGSVGALTVNGQVSPGPAATGGIARLAVSSLTMNNGSSFRVQLGNFNDNTDRDYIQNSGSATISGTVTVYVDSSLLSNWDYSSLQSWAIIVGGITSTNGFVVDQTTYWNESDFPKQGGVFRLSAADGNLVLTFYPFGTAYAGLLAGWDVAGLPGNGPSVTSVVHGSYVEPGIQITRGSGLSAASASDSFSSSEWTVDGTNTDALSNGDYLTFTIQASVGYAVVPTQIQWRLYRSGSGPSNVSVRFSTDSFAQDKGTLYCTNPTTALNTNIALTAVTSGVIEVRILGYGAGTAGGTLRIDNGANFGAAGVDFALFGYVVQGMPRISVLGTNLAEIADGDTTPALADGTDFGDVPVDEGTKTHTFTITNSGSAFLRMGNVAIGGSHPGDFTVTYPTTVVNTLLATNAGFEAGSGNDATGWWRYENAGRESWAARSGSYGMAWWAWSDWYGGFGADLALSLSNGDVVTFAIWGSAETGFVGKAGSEEAWIKLEFWSGSTKSYEVVTNIYWTLVSNYNTWVQYNLTVTNTQDDITMVKPIVGFGNVVGYNVAGVKWDDASLSCWNILAPGSTTTFSVTFDPSAAGTRTATIYITNNTADKTVYDFVIQGTGAVPGIVVLGTNGAAIADGDTSPSLSDGTDFGDVPVDGATKVHMFTITNSGRAVLRLEDVAIGGTHASDFSVTVQPFRVVAPNLITSQASFEEGTNAWTMGGNCAQHQEFYGMYARHGTNFMSAWWENVSWRDVPVTAGKTYVLSAWVATPAHTETLEGSHYGLIKMEWRDSGGNYISASEVQFSTSSTYNIQIPKGQWTLIAMTNAAPANAAYLRVGWGVWHGTGSGYGRALFDEIVAYEYPGAGGTTVFYVVFNPSAVGTRTATIYITNNTTDKTVYDFVVQGTGTWPGIGRSPTTISVSSTLGSTPSAAGFGVTNIGNGTLGYWITTNASWLTVSPVTGNLTAAQGQQHTVTFQTLPGMQAGTSNATITINAPGASNSPETVTVQWTINAIPDPSAASAVSDGNELVRLEWTKNPSYDVLIVHRATNPPSAPAQGTSYNIGDSIGTDGTKVIYKGSGSYLDHVMPTGLVHYYRFYSINNNYYSDGLLRITTNGVYDSGEIVEPFAYTNGVSLNGLNGGYGFSAGWTVANGTWTIQSNGQEACTFINMPNYPNLAGQRVKLTNPGNGGRGDARRSFPAVSTGTIYAAVMMAYNWEGANKWAGMSFLNGNSETGFVGKGYGANWYTLAIDSYGGSTVWASYDLRGLENSTNNTYLIIARYNFSTRQLAVKAYYRTDTVPLNEPTTWDATATVPSPGIPQIDGILLTAGGGSGVSIGDCYFDEIRVATSWANLIKATQPYATNYSVNTSNYVSDAQITSGVFNVTMYLRHPQGIESVSESGGYFKPNFDILNPSGVQILTDEVFSSFAYQDGGRTLIASDDSHTGYWPGDLGVYTTRWSAISSNGISTINSTILSNGTPMTFTVYDDDTDAPYLGSANLVPNPGFETNGAGWWQWGSGHGVAAASAESGSYGLYVEEQGDGGWFYPYIPTLSNTVYIFTVRAKKDAGFDVSNVYIKIEFMLADHVTVTNANEVNLNRYLSTTWESYSVIATGTAPGIAYVRPIIGVWDVGGSGSARAHFDNVALYVVPMQVKVGNAEYPGVLPSVTSTNLYYHLTDGALAGVGAADPLRLIFQAYDEGSGLSRGTTDPFSQMNIDIGSWITDNVANYDAGESVPYARTLSAGATSTWKFTSVDIGTLWSERTNLVTVSVPDADNDRSDDREWLVNANAGYLVVRDDDTAAPLVGVLGTNMVVNPGFETNAAGWAGWDDWGGAIRSVGLHGAEEGEYGVVFTNFQTAGANTWQSAGYEQWIDVAANTEYVMSIRGRKDASMTLGGGIYLKVEHFGVGGLISSVETNVYEGGLSTNWQTFSKVFTTPSSCTSNKLLILIVNNNGGSGTGAAYFDNIVHARGNARPLRVYLGGTEITPSENTSNAQYVVNAADLTNNALRLVFAAYDAGSGLARNTTDADNNCQVSIGTVIQGNVANYVSAESSSWEDTFQCGATSVWVWSSLPSNIVQQLIDGSPNAIRMTIRDADYDRADDRMSYSNVVFGYLVVTGAVAVPSKVIYDPFPNTGRLYNQGGGTGWGTNTWQCADDDLHVYDSGSFSTNKWSCPDTQGNKAMFDATENGSVRYATRYFGTNFTSGTVYFYWMQNFHHSGGDNSAYCGLYPMDGEQELVFIGKTPGHTTLGFAWWAGASMTNSPAEILNGIGNDYLIVAKYDFATRELSANVYAKTNIVAEEPKGYWDLTMTLPEGTITNINGVRIKAGVHYDPANNIGYAFFDEIRVGTNFYEVARKDGETYMPVMTNGPIPRLIFLGTNYEVGATNDLTITDGQLADIQDPIDFAVMWSNAYGVFMTNQDSTIFNIGSRHGRVNPNWDPVTKGAATNALGMDAAFTGFVGYNGALTVTTYVKNAFNITNADVGDTFYITLSAENNNTNGGVFSAPNGGDDVPFWRAITVNYDVQFYVTDDDTDSPVAGNLLLNPGFEEGDGNTASNWWRYENAGRESWAGRSGSYGMAWWAWNTWYGGFGQDVYVNVDDGDVVSFTIWGHAETGFVSTASEAFIKLEFWTGGTLSYAITNNIYTQLVANYETWTQYRVVHTNTVDGITLIKPVIGSGNWAGYNHAAVRWDDATLTVFKYPLRVYVGSTEKTDPTPGVTVHTVTDGDLASLSAVNDLRLVVQGYDAGSGLLRGTTDANRQSVLHVANLTTNNVSNFYEAGSSSDTRTKDSTNTWRWTTPFSSSVIQALMDAGSNEVLITARDADTDRTGDQGIVSNRLTGYLRVIDDDDTAPTIYATNNLLLNADFEQGTNYWTWNEDGYVFFTGDAAYNGTCGVEMVTGTGAGGEDSWGNVWQGVSGTPSNLYTMYFYARKQSDVFNAGRVYMKLEFWDDSQMIYSNQVNILPQLTTNWQLFSHSATSAPGTIEVRVSYGYDWGTAPATRVYFDGLSLVESPPPLSVWIGASSTNYPAVYGEWTNAVYRVTDGDLANVSAGNPFWLSVRAYDGHSGLQRSSDGPATTNTVLTLQNYVTNNFANYSAERSSADTTVPTATSVWLFTSFTTADIDTLYAAGSNAIRVTLRDADSDRANDQLTNTNQLFGYLEVADDDTSAPILWGFDIPGAVRSTNLLPGDIAIIAYQSDSPDRFAFVTFVDIAPSTTISFTDNGWSNSPPAFRPGEGWLHWTAPASGVAAGTVVIFTNVDSASYGVTLGTVTTAGSFNLSTDGDTILAFQGSSNNPAFLYGIIFRSGGWVSGDVTANDSQLPTSLTDRMTAWTWTRSIPNDNGYYNGIQSSSWYTLLTNIAVTSTWVISDTEQTWPTWSFSPSGTQVRFYLTDGQMADGFTITGLVQDTGSGLYRAGNYANSPTVTVYDSSGSVVTGAYFTTGPANNGDGRSTPSSLGVTLRLPVILEGVYTARVVVTDYDVDRTADALTAIQEIVLYGRGDDDTNAPRRGSGMLPGNLLRNSRFEWVIPDPGGELRALYWMYDRPDTHGGYWGTASRESWRSYPDGAYCGAIRGTWSEAGTDGGLWQEVTNALGPGSVWKASVWVWSDWNWSADSHQLRIEFWDAGASNMIEAVTNEFSAPGETWTYVSVIATAPVGAAWTRWVIGAWGVSSDGALSLDDAGLFVLTNTVHMDIVIGNKSFYLTGGSTNAMFAVTDGDLARISPTNMWKAIFNVYDPESGIQRSYLEELLNYDISTIPTLNDIYWTYSNTLSSVDTTIGTSTSVFAHVERFSVSGPGTVETGEVYKMITYAQPLLIRLSVPDADMDRENDETWMVDYQFGWLYVRDDDTNGPVVWLRSVVPTPFDWSNPTVYTNVSDGEMRSGIDFVFGLWDYSGLFLTNWIVGATNVHADRGNVDPNWDLLDPTGNQIYTNRIPPASSYHSPWGNYSFNATVVVSGITVDYNVNTVGVWRFRVSAQDLDDDRGFNLLTNFSGNADPLVSWDRAISIDHELLFNVYDDDTLSPEVTANADGRPLGVWIGSSNVVGSTSDTNAVFTVTDADLASVGGTNPVLNYSFESGDFSYWDRYGQDWRIAWSTGWLWDVHSGSNAAVNDVFWDWRNDEWRVVHQQLPVVPGEKYSASVYLRAIGVTGAAAYLELQYWDSDQQVIAQAQSAWATNEHDFRYFSITEFEAPASSVWLSVRGVVWVDTNLNQQLTNQNCHFVFDDFRVWKSSEAQPLRLVFSAYDADSGISRGTTDPTTQMNISVGSGILTNWGRWYSATESNWFYTNTVITNVSFFQNVQNYAAALSTLNSTLAESTNVWAFDALSPFDIYYLVSYGSNRVIATIPDADDDRVGDRLVLTNQQYGWLNVIDDDTNAPYAADDGLRIYLGGTELEPVSGTGTNRVWRLTEADFANLSSAPLEFHFYIHDEQSGLSRATFGPGMHMSLTITNFTTNNTANYDATRSSPFAATFSQGASSVWRFATSYTYEQLGELFGSTGWTSAIVLSAPDADSDRPLDQSWLVRTFGYLQLVDDDSAGPAAGSALLQVMVTNQLVSLAASRTNLVGGWNFNNTADLLAVSHGVGELTHNFVAVTNFSGTTLNRYGNDPAGQALAIQGGVGLANNGRYFQFEIDMSGLKDLLMTYAVRKTAQGFNSVQVAWSTDGTTFNNFGEAFDIPATNVFVVMTNDFTSVTQLNNSPNVYIRFTLDGATSAEGNHRYDNIQFRAKADAFEVTDADLAAVDSSAPFHLILNAYDPSGIARGTANNGVNMSVTVSGWVTNNTENYDASRSSADTTVSTSTSVWTWTSFSPDLITDLVGNNNSNRQVRATMSDLDDDRANDTAWSSNILFGVIRFIDDDPIPPVVGARKLEIYVGSEYVGSETVFSEEPTTNIIANWNFNNTNDWTQYLDPSYGQGVLTNNLVWWTNYLGTTSNALPGDPAGGAFAPGGTNNNNCWIQFELSMVGQSDLKMSYAIRGTSTAYTNHQWMWSIDGTNFMLHTIVGPEYTRNTNWNVIVVDFSDVAALNDAPKVYIRCVLLGATGQAQGVGAGNTRFDNVRFEAYGVLGTEVYLLTDGQLASVSAANPLMFSFNVYDEFSGLARGTSFDGTNMYVTVDGLMTNDTGRYSPTRSSSDTHGPDTTNVWLFTDTLAYSRIGELYAGGTSNRPIRATMADTDADRTMDTAWSSNYMFGFWRVIDDDSNTPQQIYTGVTNLLRNSNFEIAGSDDYKAWGWEWDNPDRHAGIWGTASREWWRWTSPTGQAAIRGTWSQAGENGGWWQEVTNLWEAGTVWYAGAWFWSDGPGNQFTCQAAGIVIEFYDGEGARVGGNTNLFDPPGETWTWIGVMATAPVSMAWARFVVFADGVGPNGALQFDDAQLKPFVPMGVQIGNRYIGPVNGDTSTNAVYELGDGDLANLSATNPLKITIGAYDAGSGLSRGTTDPSSQMNLTIRNFVLSNVVNYAADQSSTDAETRQGWAYSTWMWSSPVSESTIEALIGAGSNEIYATIFDADNDRPDDRLSISDIRYGFLRIADDDSDPPVASNLYVKGQLADGTAEITDQELRIGQWQLLLNLYDESGIYTGSEFLPTYSLINPNGVTVLQAFTWEYITTSNNRHYVAWRNWAGGVDYTNVVLGVYTVVWSAADADFDRPGDQRAVTNNPVIYGSTNWFTVVDDDTTPPTPPSNLTVQPVWWTNQNYFIITYDPATDASGIREYRYSTNATPPSSIEEGTVLGGTYITNSPSVVVVNGGFEIGQHGEMVDEYPETANSWTYFGVPIAARCMWDSTVKHTGTNSMRHVVDSGGIQARYTILGQSVFISNSLGWPVHAELSGWFLGDMSHSQNGDYGGGFLKMEFLNADSQIVYSIDNEWYEGRPLHGKNVTTWSNVILRTTNGPANTAYIRVLAGINNFGTRLAFTGWWDNITLTVRLVSVDANAGLLITNAPIGSNTIWVFAVDDDDDRPNDRLKSENVSVTTYYDPIPPPKIEGLTSDWGPDESSEVILQWTPLTDHATAGGGTNLSPWYSYLIFYTDEERAPTTNDPYIAWWHGYYALATNVTSSIIVSNLVPDTAYRFAIAGMDRAGNIGPISDPVTIVLAGFYMTQGVTRLNLYPELFWTTATNEYGHVIRQYDLLYCDAMNFSEALTNQWKLLATGYTNSMIDLGDPPARTPPWDLIHTMRFYRAAGHDRWLTNRDPRIGTAEIYGLKTFRLYRGQNWIALPFVPDCNTVYRVFGNGLPAGEDAARSTTITWYERLPSQTARITIWLDGAGSQNIWRYAYPPNLSGEPANDLAVPLDEGVIIEIPTNASQPQVVVFVGRIPTNRISSGLSGLGSYNLAGFNQPRWVHPNQLGLLESGFKGGAYPNLSDKLWAFDRVQQKAKPQIWYDSTQGKWRWNITPNFPEVQSWERPFGPDDAIVILTSPTNQLWVWTNRVLYSIPTRTFSP